MEMELGCRWVGVEMELGVELELDKNTKFKSLPSSIILISKNLTQNSQQQFLLMFVSYLKYISSLMISLPNLL